MTPCDIHDETCHGLKNPRRWLTLLISLTALGLFANACDDNVDERSNADTVLADQVSDAGDVADSGSDDVPGEDTAPSDTAADTSAPDTSADTLSDAGADTVEAQPIRFVLDVSNDIPESIWVQLNGNTSQPGWISVTDATGGRIWLREQCGVPDCPSGPVCGAALPMVRDITDGTFTGSISFDWDGLTSMVTAAEQCEVRVPVEDGSYTASFCWSLQADVRGTGDPAEGVEGEVINPVCVDVDFTIPDDDGVVTYSIMGG